MSDKSVALQEFTAHAVTVQSFERVAQQAPGWDGLDVVQRQAVNVTLDAIARVLHGDAQSAGVWACGATALSLAGEFVTFTPADTIPNIDADGWIEWHGGECPVPGGVQVAVRFQDGREPPRGIGQHWDWSHLPAQDSRACGNIIAYRVVK